MAFRICAVLFWAYISASCFQGADAYFDCPDVLYNGQLISGFKCPRSTDASDYNFCCNQGTTSQYCCNYGDYYDFLSTGAIVGIAIGSLVFIGVVIVSIIMCCVCCVKAAATSTHRPVTMHTVSVPQQPTYPQQLTIQQPAAPGYYYPQPMPQPNQYAPPPYNQAAAQPAAQLQPIPGQNPAIEKNAYSQ